MAPHRSSDDEEPTALRHIAGGDANLAHGDFLRGTGRTDACTVGWAITSLFYAALHYVRAYLLAEKKEQVARHEEMRSFYEQYKELRRTRPEYDLLKQESQSARYYLSDEFTWSDYDKLRKSAHKVRNTWVPLVRKSLGLKEDDPPPGQ